MDLKEDSNLVDDSLDRNATQEPGGYQAVFFLLQER
jgi:hypothetical protein